MSLRLQQMRTIILHIGMHKTGTTSIQEAIHQLNHDSIKTLMFDEKNHSIPFFTMFSGRKFGHPELKQRGLTENEIANKRIKYRKDLNRQLNNKRVNVFLVSGEDISFLDTQEQFSMCQYFLAKGLNVQVIWVVRDPFQWAVSISQEAAKHGAKSLSKYNPDYSKRISGFLKAVNRENIFVLKYEEIVQQGFLQTFSQLFGVQLKHVPILNESLSAEALTLIFLLNKLALPNIDTAVGLRVKRIMLTNIASTLSVNKGYS